MAARIASRPICEPEPSSPSAKSAPADDRLLAPNPGDRGRAGAGDDQPAVRAGVGADAGGGRIVRRAHQAKAGKGGRYSRRVAFFLEPGEPEADRDQPPIGVLKSGLRQKLVDDRPQRGDGAGKINMDVRRGAARLRERFSVRVAQSRAARVAPPSTPR